MKAPTLCGLCMGVTPAGPETWCIHCGISFYCLASCPEWQADRRKRKRSRRRL